MIVKSTACDTFLANHSGRFVTKLGSEPEGLIKVLNLVRTSLNITEYSLSFDPSNFRRCEELSATSGALGDVKSLLYISKVPFEIPALKRKICKTKDAYHECKKQWDMSGKIEKRSLIKAGTYTLGSAKKILSLTTNAFVKPVLLADKYLELGGAATKIGEGWEVVSLVRTGLKLGCSSGKLYLGCKRPVKRVFEIILDFLDLLFGTLRLHQIPIHPAVNITLSSI
ncbi:MAG: hypothetical protein K940chlam9_00521, partial [Chlamydiae bacterium]|nr:hypothetical protein [Chlamydiota bacterium]